MRLRRSIATFLTAKSEQGHRLVQSRVRQARFKRRPTIVQSLEIRVSWRGEAPLVPPNILPSCKKALALEIRASLLANILRWAKTLHLGRSFLSGLFLIAFLPTAAISTDILLRLQDLLRHEMRRSISLRRWSEEFAATPDSVANSPRLYEGTRPRG